MNDDHAHMLDKATALNRFDRGMSLDEAEAAAHKQYMRDQSLDAAIHHLTHMKVAQALGDVLTAGKCAKMYAVHLERAGFNPNGPVPKEVASKIGKTRLYEHEFKPHGMDSFVEMEK
jgi:hypothetical protein